MIVRENEQTFYMIEQHYHAHMSRIAMEKWADERFWRDSRLDSVLYAIEHHDRGWRMFDQEPFWNDRKNAPYTFIDFPTLAKTVLYKQGVDEVEEIDPYAALLCSEHYVRFMTGIKQKEAERFVNQEKARQHRIISSLPLFEEVEFIRHYELLKFADNVSLYICLNEPGVSIEKAHPFFKEGIPIDRSMIAKGKIQADWKNEDTIELTPFPFRAPFEVVIKEKEVPKTRIAQYGFLQCYKEAKLQERKVLLKT